MRACSCVCVRVCASHTVRTLRVWYIISICITWQYDILVYNILMDKVYCTVYIVHTVQYTVCIVQCTMCVSGMHQCEMPVAYSCVMLSNRVTYAVYQTYLLMYCSILKYIV